MSLTKQFLRKGAMMLTLIFLMSNFLPVFADESKTQTGAMLTESVSLTELEDINLSSTGEIILNQNLESNNDLSSTGSEIKQESNETGSGKILDEEEKIIVSTGSNLLQTEDETTETGSVIKINEKEINKDEKQVKGEKEFELKKQWSDDEVIDLGYMPGEVIIKFKKDQVDLEKTSGKQKVEDFIAKNSADIAETVIQKVSFNKADLGGKFDELSNQEKAKFKENFLKLKQNLDFANLSVIELGVDDSVKETIEALKNNPEIEYVVPNYTFSLSSVIPNDLYYSSQWALENTAQSLIGSGTYINNNPVSYTATTDADIDISDAWSEVSGTDKVIVAVLDSGIQYSHPDLNDNMWDGSTTCYSTTGTLILGGCPHHGWNYVNNGNAPDNPMDDNRHGTNIAGIIGGEQNYLGIAGMTENVELMAVKIATSTGFLVNLINGVQFAQNNGAKIINASIVLDDPEAEKEVAEIAFNNFISNGGLVVAGAGNNYRDNDTNPIYPSSFESDGLISVAATEQNDEIAYFENYWGSNWGENSVDVAAPGVNILTTDLDGDYYYAWGTSMATPHVTGLAAMIWAERPDFTALQVKQRIMDTVDYISDLHPVSGEHPIKSGGRINAYNALHGLNTYIPPLVLTPTIHAKSTGGNWNSASTWVENRVPNSGDVVEINGTVSITSSTPLTVAGLEVKTGSILRDYVIGTDHTQNYTLTISGDLLNSGTIQSYYTTSGAPYYNPYYNNSFTVEVLGDIQNNGAFNLMNTSGYGKLYIKSHSDIANSGTWSPTSSYLTWSPVPTATDYQFQMTNTSGVWQAEETFTTTQKQVANSLINETHLWRTRAKVNGVYGDWSAEHEIN